MAACERLIVQLFAGSVLMATAASGQIGGTVDILSPGDEGYEGIPSNLLVLDVFVDVAQTDAWTAAGTLVQLQHGAEFRYFDGDLITPGIQPDIFGPGFENRFNTCFSRPLGRNAFERFDGEPDPTPPPAVTEPTLLEVAYFVSPPATSGSPSVDGYLARIAVDLSATPYQPEDLIVTYSRPDFFLLECDRATALPGFFWATFDVPALSGMDFWVTVPEPATLALLLCGGAALVGRRRE